VHLRGEIDSETFNYAKNAENKLQTTIPSRPAPPMRFAGGLATALPTPIP